MAKEALTKQQKVSILDLMTVLMRREDEYGDSLFAYIEQLLSESYEKGRKEGYAEALRVGIGLHRNHKKVLDKLGSK